jgi:hypothetical protein
MKISNLKRFSAQRGLENGGRLEKAVWSEFQNDRKRLSAEVGSIKAQYKVL